jgi:hypothetical protein
MIFNAAPSLSLLPGQAGGASSAAKPQLLVAQLSVGHASLDTLVRVYGYAAAARQAGSVVHVSPHDAEMLLVRKLTAVRWKQQLVALVVMEVRPYPPRPSACHPRAGHFALCGHLPHH